MLDEAQLQAHDDAMEKLIENENRLMRLGLPAALVKALSDPFQYACGLKDGTVFLFSGAQWEEGSPWVHLDPCDWDGDEIGDRRLPCSFERGIDVRLSEVAWVADAPFGS